MLFITVRWKRMPAFVWDIAITLRVAVECGCRYLSGTFPEHKVISASHSVSLRVRANLCELLENFPDAP